MSYPRILQRVYREPWCIKPSAHLAIQEALTNAMNGKMVEDYGEIKEEITIVGYEEQDKQKRTERGGPIVNLNADDLKGQDLAEYVRNHKPEYAYGHVTVSRNDGSKLEEADFIGKWPLGRRVRYYANGKIERKQTVFLSRMSVWHEGFEEDGSKAYFISQNITTGKYDSGNTFDELGNKREEIKNGNGILTINWNKEVFRERIKFADGEIVSRQKWNKAGNVIK